MQRWSDLENLHYNKLAIYGQLVGGQYGSSRTQTQPYYTPSPLQQIAGGLAAGACPFFNPWKV